MILHSPAYEDGPIVSSETSAIRTQTPGNYPKRNKLHLEHGEILKTRIGLYRLYKPPLPVQHYTQKCESHSYTLSALKYLTVHFSLIAERATIFAGSQASPLCLSGNGSV